MENFTHFTEAKVLMERVDETDISKMKDVSVLFVVDPNSLPFCFSDDATRIQLSYI